MTLVPKAMLTLKSPFLAELKGPWQTIQAGLSPEILYWVSHTKSRQLRPRRVLRGRNVTQMHYARIVFPRRGTVSVLNIRAPQGSSETMIGNSVFTLRSHGEQL
jgi:hypothetical protein